MWLAASLGWISRHLGKLMRAMEYLLAHDVPVLTANYLLRPHEVCRSVVAELASLSTIRIRSVPWRVSRGLSGAHRVTVAKVVQLLEAEEQAPGA